MVRLGIGIALSYLLINLIGPTTPGGAWLLTVIALVFVFLLGAGARRILESIQS